MADEAVVTLATADAAPVSTPAAAPAPAAPAADASTPPITPAVEKTSTELKAEADAKAEQDAADAQARADALANETPEQKTAREAKEKADADNQVPEKYDLKLPDGQTRDEEITGKFEAAAKELGLSQANAQRLYDIGNQAVLKAHAQLQEGVAKTQASWVDASKADAEFGGAKLNENLAVAKKALDLNPAMKTLLNESKLGDHPEVIRWMFRVGQKLSEDSFVPSGQAPAGDRSIADRLYK